MKTIFAGTIELLAKPNGVLCLLILGCITVLGLQKDLDGNAAAAAFATVSSVFMWTGHKVEIESLKK